MIKAVMFDFGGVLSASPFESFARYERDHGLAEGTIRSINSTNPDTNAWAQLERGSVDLGRFCALFESEARALGAEVEGREVLGCLAGDIRPEMVEAVRRCGEHFKTACLTNNFVPTEAVDRPDVARVYELFDVVIESSRAGVRKPDPRFYELACEALSVVPDEAVFLDDLGINLKAARALGMQTIKVTSSRQALDELAAVVGIPMPS